MQRRACAISLLPLFFLLALAVEIVQHEVPPSLAPLQQLGSAGAVASVGDAGIEIGHAA